MHRCPLALLAALVSILPCGAILAAPEANYDEAKVPSYKLPDPLVLLSGERVADAKTWR